MPDRLLASVRNELRLCRTYWQNRQIPRRACPLPVKLELLCPRCNLFLTWAHSMLHASMYRQEEGRGGTWEAVDLEESMWSLDSSEDVDGEAIRTLMISLVKPPLTETEVTWKRGARCSARRGPLLGAPGSAAHSRVLFLAAGPGMNAVSEERSGECRQASGQQGQGAARQPGEEGLPLLCRR